MIRPLLSRWQKIRALVSLLGFVSLICIYYFFILQPSLKSLSECRNAISSEESSVVLPSQQNISEESIKEELSNLKKQKKNLDALFVREKNIPPLTRTLRNLSKKNNMDLRNSVKVSVSGQQGHFVKAECSLTAIGKYEDAIQFLYALAEEGCIIQKADMSIITDGGDEQSVKLSLSMSYYRYNK